MGKIQKKDSITLYHGTSFDKLDKVGVDVTLGDPFSDFGRGFYLTSTQYQAVEWAKHRALKFKTLGYVYVFRLDTTILDKFKVLNLDSFSAKCLDILTQCRLEGNNSLIEEYDLVQGVIADSKTAEILIALESYRYNKIDIKNVIKALKPKDERYNQYCFRTKNIVEHLRLVAKIEI